MRLFGFPNDPIGFFLRHLAAPYHVLHDVASAFDREASQSGGGVDDVLDRLRDLAPGFLTDFLRSERHFGDSVARVRAAVSGGASRDGRLTLRRGRWHIGGLGLCGLRLVHHRYGALPIGQ